MNFRITTYLLPLILISGCAHVREADGDRLPKIRMDTAISIARSYVKGHEIDVSGQFLSRVVSFHDVYHPENTGWRLTWIPADAVTLDGEWSIYVYDDGRVTADEE